MMIGAAIRKDMLLLVRDRGALISLFLLPLLFIGVFGAIFQSGDGGPGGLDLAVFDEGESNQAIVAGLERDERVRVRRVADEAAARAAVVDREASAGLVLPADFSPLSQLGAQLGPQLGAQLGSGLGGHPARLFIDGQSSPQQRAAVEGAVTGLLVSQLFGPGAAPPVVVESAREGGSMESVGGFQISVPGNAVLFGFFLALTVALSFLEDRRSGVFRRLLSSPARRSTLLLCKLVPFLLIGLIQMTVLFGVGALLFGMELGGSVVGLMALTSALVLCAVSLGLFIASFGGTEKQVGGIGSIALLVMGLLGGAMVPRIVMPAFMQDIGLITPHAWALDGYYALLVGDAASASAVFAETLAVLGFAALFAVLGVALFRFE